MCVAMISRPPVLSSWLGYAALTRKTRVQIPAWEYFCFCHAESVNVWIRKCATSSSSLCDILFLHMHACTHKWYSEASDQRKVALGAKKKNWKRWLPDGVRRMCRHRRDLNSRGQSPLVFKTNTTTRTRSLPRSMQLRSSAEEKTSTRFELARAEGGFEPLGR